MDEQKDRELDNHLQRIQDEEEIELARQQAKSIPYWKSELIDAEQDVKTAKGMIASLEAKAFGQAD